MQKPQYSLTDSGIFEIENYNQAKPFANFFPGMAGEHGIPMWAFYVNRGQCIASCGTRNKDHAILEFFPANKAWHLTPSLGFRTFIKISRKSKEYFYEPFRNTAQNIAYKCSNKMSIRSCDLTIEETNRTLSLSVKVEYFPIPHETYAGLARVVTIKNISKTPQTIQMLDGAPRIIPCTTADMFLKNLGRTIEAWMHVDYLDNGTPFLKLDVDPTDRPEIVHFDEGNFYLGFHYANNKKKILSPIVDPEYIFGPGADFDYPVHFAEGSIKQPKDYSLVSKTPCTFFQKKTTLTPQAETSLFAITGMMRSKTWANMNIGRIACKNYLAQKRTENEQLIDSLQNEIATTSSSPAFDYYARQTYLDNIARGGYPVKFTTGGTDTIVHMYSRKHGDLERDYNKFLIEPSYFSQGNGNYRDLNQNRRCDIWFHPEIQEENILTFFNLIQIDGYNPLVVKNADFFLTDEKKLKKDLALIIPAKKDREQILAYAHTPFTPGKLLFFLEEHDITITSSTHSFLETVLGCCDKIQQAEHGEGFWTDHWTYNTDTLEMYQSMYPEKMHDLLFKKNIFTYYDNDHVPASRKQRYIIRKGKVRQFEAVVLDPAKKELIQQRAQQPHHMRTKAGKGPIYATTLINKLLCLAVNKTASLDPFGIGIEMDTDKPNWYDALNGLPGLLGSSVCETMELHRLITFMLDILNSSVPKSIRVTSEVGNFLIQLDKCIKKHIPLKQSALFTFWAERQTLKEQYRDQTRFGVSGDEKPFTTKDIIKILERVQMLTHAGIKKAYDKKQGLYYSYFINEVITYTHNTDGNICPTKFRQKKLPLFLEGNVHALRIAKDQNSAHKLHSAVKKSPLYDKKLKMYKVNTALETMPEEIGRCRIFAPGWLENESIWLHMEFKYLLELLKQGLYTDFYADFKNVLVPFLDPEQYGRSILENVSFIASSAFPDQKLQGNGFVARLSGSTAEFLNMWVIMNVGHAGFFLDAENTLNLRLSPILKGWLFSKKDKTYQFNLLSKIPVTYHNPSLKDTFGSNGVTPKNITLTTFSGKKITFQSDCIPAPYAQQIRNGKIAAIDVLLK